MVFSSKTYIFIEGFFSEFVSFKYVCKEILKFTSFWQRFKTPDKTIADERLIICRGMVLFRVDISRLADESFRLIFVKQPAQV